MCASGGPSRPGRPFLASGGPFRPGVAKLEGVALRCKGLLRKKEAAPAFKLVKYATMGRQDAQQCSSTAARHIAHTLIRQHAIAVARLQRRGGEAMQPDSKRTEVPSATRIRQLASGVVVGAAALSAEIGHAGTGAFGQPRARPSRLQGDEYVAASRSGAHTGGTIRFIMKNLLIVIANSAIICSEGFIAEINNRTRF